MLGIDEIFIFKKDKNTGEASLKIIDDDNEDLGSLNIKKIQINMLDSTGYVKVLKSEGVGIISGPMFDFFSDAIIESWESIDDEEAGIYRITENQIVREG